MCLVELDSNAQEIEPDVCPEYIKEWVREMQKSEDEYQEDLRLEREKPLPYSKILLPEHYRNEFREMAINLVSEEKEIIYRLFGMGKDGIIKVTGREVSIKNWDGDDVEDLYSEGSGKIVGYLHSHSIAPKLTSAKDLQKLLERPDQSRHIIIKRIKNEVEFMEEHFSLGDKLTTDFLLRLSRIEPDEYLKRPVQGLYIVNTDKFLFVDALTYSPLVLEVEN